MWKSDDDFWLTVPEKDDLSPLLLALGLEPLRITASINRDDEDDSLPVKRDGYLDVKISSFDRKSNLMSVSVSENTTGLKLHDRILTIKVDEYSDDIICRIEEIHGITFIC